MIYEDFLKWWFIVCPYNSPCFNSLCYSCSVWNVMSWLRGLISMEMLHSRTGCYERVCHLCKRVSVCNCTNLLILNACWAILQSNFQTLTSSLLLHTFIGEEQNKEALQDVEDENQWDTKANKRTHLWPPFPFPTKTLSVTLRTTKSDFYIGSQNLGSCPVGFLYFYFFLHSLKVLKGKSEFLWILLVPAFRFFKTLTGLRKGSFSITVLSPARCGDTAIRSGCWHLKAVRLVGERFVITR